MENPIRNPPLKVQHASDAVTFVQVQRTALAQMRRLTAEAPRATRLLLWMVEVMDRRGVLVASRATMARALGVSEATVKRSLAQLEVGDWIQRINIGPGTVSAFAVNARVAWTGSRENLPRLAVFQATVIADYRDQNEVSLRTTPLKSVPEIIPPDIASLVGQLESVGDQDEFDL